MMLLLRKAHLGEVSVSFWPQILRPGADKAPLSRARTRAHAHPRPLLAITSSMHAIADALNRDRAPTAQGGAQWYAATVRHVLLRKSWAVSRERLWPGSR